MDTESSIKRELFEYYNERAQEYEEFYWGRFGAKIPNPDIYRNDTIGITQLLPNYVRGKCIDIACGTGFWLPVYEKNCHWITLIDQSEGVLEECSKKIQKLGIENKTEIICGDLFDYPYKKNEYNTAVIGFLISHFNDTELNQFFDIVKTLLVKNGRFVIIDSTWNQELAGMGREKVGFIERILMDGRRFTILKRYFERQTVLELTKVIKADIEVIFWGNVFFLAVGYFPQ